jgi:hypothetical protein
MSPKNKRESSGPIMDYSALLAPILIVVASLLTFVSINAPVPKIDNNPPITKYRIAAQLLTRWPKRLYEGSSGSIAFSLAPRLTDYVPSENEQAEKIPLNEKTLLPKPRVKIVLATDSTVDIVGEKSQEQTYDRKHAIDFSWSIYARETGDHRVDARIYLENAKDQFVEMKVSPRHLDFEVTKADHISRANFTLGTILGGVVGFVFIVVQIKEKLRRPIPTA